MLLSPRPDEWHFRIQHVMPIYPQNVKVSSSSYPVGLGLWCWLGLVYGQNKMLRDETPWHEGKALTTQPMLMPYPNIPAGRPLFQVYLFPWNPRSSRPQHNKVLRNSCISWSGFGRLPCFSHECRISLKSPQHNHGSGSLEWRCFKSRQDSCLFCCFGQP